MQPKRDNKLIERLKLQMQDEGISDELKISINDLIADYERVTFGEWSDKKEFFAQAFSGMVNDFGFDEKHLAKAMSNDHSTIQQSYMRLFKAFVGFMAEKSLCDGRNKASVQLAKEINDKVKDACLPII